VSNTWEIAAAKIKTTDFLKTEYQKNKKAAVFMLRPLFITIIQLINKIRRAIHNACAPNSWSHCAGMHD
jgi:hypothetical protein